MRIILALALCAAGCAVESVDPEVARTLAALENNPCASAALQPGEDARVRLEACRAYAARNRMATRSAVSAAAAALTVVESQVAATSANLSNVPAWSNSTIRAQFRKQRDTRFMYMKDDSSFLRRPSWLYPDDGCYARAELVSSGAGSDGLVKPKKLFSFPRNVAQLIVETDNHVDGFVPWLYHVVPVVKSSSTGTVYVLDPAIDPSQPLQWQSWLLRQVPALSNANVSLADANAYFPDSPVSGGANRRPEALDVQQQWFLWLEGDRQNELGRVPDEVLGEKPPWRKDKFYYVDSGDGFVLVSACHTCNSDAHALTQRCFNDCS